MSPGSGSVVAGLRLAAALLAAGSAGAHDAVVVERSQLLSREVVTLPAGSFSSYEYELAPQSELIFVIQTAQWRREALRVWLVNATNFERMSNGETFEYLQSGTGLVDREARISFAVPGADTYFLVLDNSASSSQREVDVYAYVRTDEESPSDERARQRYEAFYDRLSRLVDIDHIEVHVRRCGESNAFTVGSLIVICRELDDLLSENAPPGVPLFVFLHEISHNLIAKWGYRSIYADQRMVDRLAVTLFAMFDDEVLARQAAEWFADASHASRERFNLEAVSLRRSRSRRISSWLRNKQDLSRGWTRRIVVPKMSTSALEHFVEADHVHRRTRRSMQQELAERREPVARR